MKRSTSSGDQCSSVASRSGTELKAGLARPLEGMGTAFSTSMLGLAGALVLGFMDLTAGQAQNRFTNELEEWVAGLTRLSSGVLGQEGEGTIPAYVQALLEQTAENLEGLQSILARGEEGPEGRPRLAEVVEVLLELGDRVARLAQRLGEPLVLERERVDPPRGVAGGGRGSVGVVALRGGVVRSLAHAASRCRFASA